MNLDGFHEDRGSYFRVRPQKARLQLVVSAEKYVEHGNNYWWFLFPGAACAEAIILSFSLPIQTALAKYKTDSTINVDSIRDSGENLLAENITLR